MPQAAGLIFQAIGSQIGGIVGGIAGKAAGQFAATATVTLLEAGVQLAISAGLQRAFAPDAPSPGDVMNPFRQPTPSRQSAFGRVRSAGPYMLFEEYDGQSYDVVAFHDGPIDGVEQRFLHDDPVTVGSGSIDGTSYSDVVSLVGSGGQYQNCIRWNETLGSASQSAHAAILNHPEWTSGHRGDGVASIGLRLYNVKASRRAEAFPYGMCLPSVEYRAQTCFDPRNGAHDAGDRTSWAWSDLTALELLTFLISTDCGGLGLDYDRKIAPSIADWQSAANDCAETVALAAGGTQSRYSAGWVFQHSTDPIETITALLDACDGRLVEKGDGSLSLSVGKWYDPSVTFTDDHIIAWRWEHFRAAEQAENEFIAEYVSPDHQYQPVASEPWREEDEITAAGAVRTATFSLHAVQSHALARRLMKRRAKRARARRGWVRLNLFGLQAWNERYVRIQNSVISSMADITVEVLDAPRIDFETGTVELSFIEMDSSIDAWDAATEEGTAPGTDSSTNVTGPSSPAISSVSVLTDGGIRMQVNVTKPPQLYLDYAVRYRTDDGAGNYGDWKVEQFEDVDTSSSLLALVTGVVPASLYQLQAAAVSPLGTWTDWSTIQSVDATAVDTPDPPGGVESGTL